MTRSMCGHKRSELSVGLVAGKSKAAAGRWNSVSDDVNEVCVHRPVAMSCLCLLMS